MQLSILTPQSCYEGGYALVPLEYHLHFDLLFLPLRQDIHWNVTCLLWIKL